MSLAALICVVLAALGGVMAFGRLRAHRTVAAARWLGWALVALGLAMTGTAHLVGKIGHAITVWATSFVWNPLTWVGVVVLAIAVVLLVVTGVLSARESGEEELTGSGRAALPESRRQTAKTGKGSASGLEGFEDIEELLRRRGVK